VQDIVAGQINTFEGTNLARLPDAEKADTTTIGVVFTPTFLPALRNPILSIDYYNIKVKDYIDAFSAQETLDGCYVQGLPEFCQLIVRVNGDIASPASGVQRFTTNLDFRKAEGIEWMLAFGLDMETLGLEERWGALDFSLSGNHYINNEFKSGPTVPVTNCNGFFGNACGNPTFKTRFVQRTTWSMGDLQLSYLWRWQDNVEIETVQQAATFAAFRSIKSYSYFDLAANYMINDATKVSFSVNNVFAKKPPIVGNEAGTTATNSGNTLPSAYDNLGRVLAVGLNLRF